MRSTLAHATRVEEARHGVGAVSVEALRLPDRRVFIVSAGGGAAAGQVCDVFVEQIGERGAPASWSGWLAALDDAMPRSGLAAALVVEVRGDGRIVGASAGNCQAWLFTDGGAVELTRKQHAKPLLGEGRALPVGFEARASEAVLVVATGGLWKCVSQERVASSAAIRPLDDAAAALVHAARPRGGTLRDDIAVALCEISRRR